MGKAASAGARRPTCGAIAWTCRPLLSMNSQLEYLRVQGRRLKKIEENMKTKTRSSSSGGAGFAVYASSHAPLCQCQCGVVRVAEFPHGAVCCVVALAWPA